MDGQDRASQGRANPMVEFLREFANAAGEGEYHACELLEAAQKHGLAFPAVSQKRWDPDGPQQALGRLLAGVFQERETVQLEGWSIKRVRKSRVKDGGGEVKADRFSLMEPQGVTELG